MKEHLYFYLIAVLCLTPTLSAQDDIRTEKLLPFATHRAQWHVRKFTKLEPGENGYAAKMVIDKYNEGQERWPAIVAHVPKEISDWRQVESVEFDAVSDHPEAYLAVRIYNGNNSIPYGRQPIPTNPVRVKVNVGNDIGILGHVTQLHLYQQDPEHAYTIWLSDIRLNYRENFRQEYLETHKQFERCINLPQKLIDTDRALMQKQKITFDEWRNFTNELNALLCSQFEIFMRARGNQAYSTVWVSAMEKVWRDGNPPLNTFETLTLHAAKGEVESAQLVVFAKQDLKNLTVRLAEPLKNADGKAIPESAVSVVPVGYVDCPKPPYKASRNGWWPDPLLLYADKLDLEGGKCEPWWMDVNIPKGQAPGTYKGTLRVMADGVPATDVSVSVTVHRFTLPDGSAYPLNVSFDGVSPTSVGTAVAMPETHPSKANVTEWNRSVWDMMLSHRIGCDSLYHNVPVDAAAAKYKLDHGARYFNICYLGNDAVQRFPVIDKAVEEYKKLGILDRACFYGFDEASPQKFQKISETIKAVRAHYPGIPIFTTAYDHSFGNNTESPLHDVIDWWCPLTTKYEDCYMQVAPARSKGRKVWWYICCGPREPYANIFIEFPGIQARLLLGMMYQKYKPDGFLYYAVTRWREGTIAAAKRRDTPMKNAPCTNWTGNSFCLYNGDGLLFYPGEKQILPSLRLKLLRDGMEDALYFQLLEKALANSAHMSDEWRKQAANEVQIEPTLVKSLKEFTEDQNLLEAKRVRLTRLLDEYEQAR